jgi:RNA polymerase sigma-70 factor (ECF subfamily)
MPPGESFEAVLGAAGQGQEWGFAALYQQFNPRLLRYFAARLPAEAEDLAAETWVGVARQLRSFQGDERAFGAWLFTIAHRRLVQHWRDQARRPIFDRWAETPEGRAPVDVEREVLDHIGAQQAARAIAAALTADQAEVLLLRILGGLEVDQVARIVGKRPGAVRALQHKALRKLAGTSLVSEVLTP